MDIIQNNPENNPENNKVENALEKDLEQKTEQNLEEQKTFLSSLKSKIPLPQWVFSILDIITTVFFIFIFLFIIRTYIFVPFTVQGPSMEATLHDREFIYVDKFFPFINGYNRGEVIVFTPPQERLVQTPGIMCLLYKVKNVVLFEKKENPCLVQASFVKRIIGVEGDHVEVKNGNVYITPQNGQRTKVSEDFLMEENKNKTCVPAGECSSIFSLSSEAGKDFGVVPPNSYFVLGDNRLNSSDSRSGTWGTPFIEKESISGVVRIVYLTPPLVPASGSAVQTIIMALWAVPHSFSGVRWIETANLLGQ